MFKSLAQDLTGAADICYPVKDLSKSSAIDYVLPGETVMFSLQSAKEEFAFTNHAILACYGENATTTRRLVMRYDYKTHAIDQVQYETAGHIDRDCEIKFVMGEKAFSIDIARAEDATARVYYKAIELLGREQRSNLRNWEFALCSMGHAANALRLHETSGQTLTRQSDEALVWMQTLYSKYNPRCYREVIQSAFQDIKGVDKMMVGP